MQNSIYIMTKNERMVRALIAGAAITLDYKEKHPKASEAEVISYVTKESKRIISEIEEDY